MGKLERQALPIILTIITFFGLVGILYLFIVALNLFPHSEPILLALRKRDILVGLTIYLKTSVDFALFIGNLMASNPGWKNRIAIELGTALGNAFGTFVVLAIWSFFKEVPILMVLMVTLASFVLLGMAQDSIEEFYETLKTGTFVKKIFAVFLKGLVMINSLTSPLLSKIVPHMKITKIKPMPFISLSIFSISIPFILGLDDFAGYIPLFSVINVFGFAIGVFLGHMILNIALFISPNKTVSLVRTPLVLIIGGMAFIAIAFWGFYEALHILKELVIR